MGFTHYFYRTEELDKAKWNAFMKDATKVVQNSPCPLADWDGHGKPEIESDSLTLNGVDEDSHETFRIDRVFPQGAMRQPDQAGRLFSFCKTARKPYDVVVTALLVLLRQHFGKDVSISSDGGDSAWKAGIALCQKLGIKLSPGILNKTAKFVLEVEYDPRVTDAESIASALDKLMETALSTPDILEEYGNPTVGEFFVQEE